jgi:TonB family protein
MIGKYLLLFTMLICSLSSNSQCLNIKDLVDILNGKNDHARLNLFDKSIKSDLIYKELNIQSNNSQFRFTNQDQLIIGSENEYVIFISNECYLNLINEVKREIGIKVKQLDKIKFNSLSIETYKHLSKDLIFEFIEDKGNSRHSILLANESSYNILNSKKFQSENVKQEATNKNYKPNAENDEIYTIVEEDAEYPGGYAALMKFLQDHLNYPPSAIEKGIQGKVTLKFVVEKNGTLSNVSVLKGIPGCQVCDDEALRILSKMNNWKPAKNSGKAVRQWNTLPISFAIE